MPRSSGCSIKRAIGLLIAAPVLVASCDIAPDRRSGVATRIAQQSQTPTSFGKRHADSVTLRRIARQSPCAAAALLELLQTGSVTEGGVLYLQGCPSEEYMADVLEEFERGSTNAGIAGSQWNPYSVAPLLIEVHWYAQSLADRTTLLKSRARLIRRAGIEVDTPHLVEEMSMVVISNGQLRLPEDGTGTLTRRL
jgi:hypothetical protein